MTRNRKLSMLWMAMVPVAAIASLADAGGLGIALDGFLAAFTTFVTGLGGLIFLLGLGSYVYQWISVPHSPLLGNSLTMMVLGGLFGGGPIIATQLGLITGALLPVL